MSGSEKIKLSNRRKVPIKNYSYLLEENRISSNFRFRECESNFFTTDERVVLNELFSLIYHNDHLGEHKDFKLTNCFNYFGRNFGIDRLRMQKVSYHLQNCGLITRVFREVIARDDEVYKELDIILHLEALNDFFGDGIE